VTYWTEADFSPAKTVNLAPSKNRRGTGVLSAARKSQRRSNKRINEAIRRQSLLESAPPPSTPFARLGPLVEPTSLESRLGPTPLNFRPLSQFIERERNKRAFILGHQVTVNSPPHVGSEVTSQALKGGTPSSHGPSTQTEVVAVTPEGEENRRVLKGATDSQLDQSAPAPEKEESRRASEGVAGSSSNPPDLRSEEARAFFSYGFFSRWERPDWSNIKFGYAPPAAVSPPAVTDSATVQTDDISNPLFRVGFRRDVRPRTPSPIRRTAHGLVQGSSRPKGVFSRLGSPPGSPLARLIVNGRAEQRSNPNASSRLPSNRRTY